jgi:hypothetical protein
MNVSPKHSGTPVPVIKEPSFGLCRILVKQFFFFWTAKDFIHLRAFYRQQRVR